MAGAKFKVVFDGQILNGADPDQVRDNLAKIFKTDADKVEHLFVGERKLIRRDVDEATARKFQAAFNRAGAIAVIVDSDGQDLLPEPPASAPARSPKAARTATRATQPAPLDQTASDQRSGSDTENAQPTRAELAEAGRAPPPLATRGLPSAPANMTMAEAGEVLLEAGGAIDAPDIDTSHLSMADVGEDLGERKSVVQARFDLSAYELAPAGAAMSSGA